MKDQPVILFDGVCNLCNGFVQYIIRHDPEARFKFASLQSAPAERLLQRNQLPPPELNSILLLQENQVYQRSTAALRIARELKGPVKLLYGFIIVPAFIRNAIYDWIARNRYKWFGKSASCMVPTPELEARFLN